MAEPVEPRSGQFMNCPYDFQSLPFSLTPFEFKVILRNWNGFPQRLVSVSVYAVQQDSTREAPALARQMYTLGSLPVFW